MDLAYNGCELKLLEYNADTPTALVESAVAQWYWLNAVFPGADQFNSIHEHLVAKWKATRRLCAAASAFRVRAVRRRLDDHHLSAGHRAAGGTSQPSPSAWRRSGGMGISTGLSMARGALWRRSSSCIPGRRW